MTSIAAILEAYMGNGYGEAIAVGDIPLKGAVLSLEFDN